MIRLPEQIEGRGVLLRRWRADDAEALGEAVAESVEHLRPWMPWISQEPQTLEQRRAMIERWAQEWASGGDVFMGVFAEDRIAGGCGLHQRIGPGGLEIGYWIHPAFTRRGLATSAAALLTEAAFSVPGIDHVEIHHDKANRASAGIPRRLGFRFCGETPDKVEAPGEVGVEQLWRMDLADWRERPGHGRS